jgi:hypothetical protein
MMKIRFFAAAACCALCLALSACGSSSAGRPDAAVLLREARTAADSMSSCAASVSDELVFSANSRQHTRSAKTDLVYAANPFGLKSVQSSGIDGVSADSETYLITENGGISFYCRTSSGWQKSSAENLDVTPSAQIDILKLLGESESQTYVRDVSIGTHNTHKIELKLQNEALRSTIENIVTLSGMAGGSKTIVQTLLDSAPALYGYCYVDAESGEPLRIELDASDALNQIFEKVSGSSISVKISKCVLRGDFSDFGSASAVSLPDEAKNAVSVQAKG